MSVLFSDILTNIGWSKLGSDILVERSLPFSIILLRYSIKEHKE